MSLPSGIANSASAGILRRVRIVRERRRRSPSRRSRPARRRARRRAARSRSAASTARAQIGCAACRSRATGARPRRHRVRELVRLERAAPPSYSDREPGVAERQQRGARLEAESRPPCAGVLRRAHRRGRGRAATSSCRCRPRPRPPSAPCADRDATTRSRGSRSAPVAAPVPSSAWPGAVSVAARRMLADAPLALGEQPREARRETRRAWPRTTTPATDRGRAARRAAVERSGASGWPGLRGRCACTRTGEQGGEQQAYFTARRYRGLWRGAAPPRGVPSRRSCNPADGGVLAPRSRCLSQPWWPSALPDARGARRPTRRRPTPPERRTRWAMAGPAPMPRRMPRSMRLRMPGALSRRARRSR